MTNDRKLQCLSTSEWLRWYAQTLDPNKYSSLKYEMNKAADLLAEVWQEHEAQNTQEERA